MKTEVRSVTPYLASEMLKRNYNNRKLNENHVGFLSREMTNGHWLFDGQPIRFDIHSRLLDGQHRLTAIVDSKTTQDLLIVSGLPEETFQVMDTGRTRSGADTFHVMGKDNYAALASSASFTIRFLQGKFSRHGSADKLSNSDLVDWVENNQSIIDDIKESYPLYNDFSKVMTVTHIAGLLFIMKKIDVVYAENFMRKLCTGLGLEKDSPIAVLRKKLTHDKLSKASLPLRDKMALIIKAWNLFRKGESCRLIRWNSDVEKFPKMI